MGRYQFFPGCHIDTEITGRHNRRAAYTHMHLLSTCLAHHIHNTPGSCTPDNAVIHQDNLLTFKILPDGIELQPDRSLPHFLVRHDKGPADIPVLHQAFYIINTRFLAVPDGESYTAVRDWGNNISINGMFVQQPLTNADPGLVDKLPVNNRISAGKIDVFEHTMGSVLCLEQLVAGISAVLEYQDLSGPYITNKLTTDSINSSTLRCDHISPVQLTQA